MPLFCIKIDNKRFLLIEKLNQKLSSDFFMEMKNTLEYLSLFQILELCW